MRKNSKPQQIQFEAVTPTNHVNVDRLCTTYAYVYSPTFEFMGEKHEAWEIIYLTKGEAIVETDDVTCVLKSGQIYIHKPFDFHKIKANNTACNVGIVSFYSQSKPLYDIADKPILLTSYQRNLILKAINEGMLYLAGINHVPPLLSNERPEYASGQVMKNLLELFLIDLLRAEKRIKSTDYALSSQSKDDTLVHNIKFFLAQNVSTPLTLKQISSEFNYSVSHLCNSFKRGMGISIMNYFILLRIEHAKKLIHEGKKTIKEISEELNFDTLQYFSFQFKKHTGYSPSQYSSLINTYKILDTPQPNKVTLLITSNDSEDEDAPPSDK